MANNTYTSIEVTEEAILGENILYFTKDTGISITNELPYAKIRWDNGNGTASYNKNSIFIKYENGVLVSARTDKNVSLVKDSNEGGSFYFKKITTNESFTLTLDYILTNKPLTEQKSVPVLSAVSNVDFPEPIDVCESNKLFDIGGIRVLEDVKSQKMETNNMKSINSNINNLIVDELSIIKSINIKDEDKSEGLAYINSGLYKLNEKVVLKSTDVGNPEISFNLDSGLVIASILDVDNTSLVDFTIVKNSIKSSGSLYNSNIILSYSQSKIGNLIKLRESLNGISLIVSPTLGGKTLSFGIISSDNNKPSVESSLEKPVENAYEYIFDNNILHHTLILGDPQECGIEITGKIKVNDIDVKNGAKIGEYTVATSNDITELESKTTEKIAVVQSTADSAIANAKTADDKAVAAQASADSAIAKIEKLEADLKLNLTSVNAKINSINDSIVI